jgi:starch phosphorylase
MTAREDPRVNASPELTDAPEPEESVPMMSPSLDVKRTTPMDKEEIKRAFLDNLFYVQGKFPVLATQHDYYMVGPAKFVTL